MQGMPQPTEQHRRLEALVGQWQGQETMHPSPWDPKGGTATSQATARLELDGFFVVMDYVQNRHGRVNYRAHGVFGWDAPKERFTMHWFDSMGSDPGSPALGTWEGNVLSFQNKSHMGHGRFTYTFTGKDVYSFKLEHSQDGQNWSLSVEGIFKRA